MADFERESDRHPSVTVVMAAHNAAGTIGATLASVEAQSLEAAEVVVVDDASTDNTMEVVERWTDRLSVRLVTLRSNSGPGHARDVGIRSATGDYIAIVDSDDFLLPDHLSVLTEPAMDGADVVVPWTVQMSEQHLTVEPQPSFRGGSPLESLLERNIGAVGLFSRLAYLDRTSGFRSGITEDWDLYIQFARSGCSFAIASKPTYVYRIRAASRSREWPALERNLAVLRKAVGEAEGPHEMAAIRRGTRRMLCERHLLRAYAATSNQQARAEAFEVFPGPWKLMVRAALVLVSPTLAGTLRRRYGSVSNRIGQGGSL